MKRKLSEDIKSLINAYEFLVKGIDTKAKEAEDRAYGGIIRAGKWMLVESLVKSLIEIAWKKTGKDPFNPIGISAFKPNEFNAFLT